jgi:hypothetical protein
VIVWDGHSCPLLLILTLPLGLTPSTATLKVNTNTNTKINSNGVGQECPTHTHYSTRSCAYPAAPSAEIISAM